jgi:hypothetical protein
MKEFASLQQAVKEYTKLFKAKTGKGYVALKMQVQERDDSNSKTLPSSQSSAVIQKSSLHDQVLKLMKFISDKDQMKISMQQKGLDLNKMPLGRLSQETINQGYYHLT